MGQQTRAVEWCRGLPELRGDRACLREPVPADAPSLLAQLTARDVVRFLSPPPSTLASFEQFISRARKERRSGRSFCYAVVPEGQDEPAGLFQVHRLDSSFATAEWGFVLAQRFWGTGLFDRGASLLLDYLFGSLGVHRLEARAMADNARAHGVLRRIGAVQDGRLRRSFLLNGQYYDDILWSILDEDWNPRRNERVPA